MSFKPDEMRKRFHDLGAEREKILKEAAPFRQERDGMRRKQDELRDAMKPLEEKIRAIEKALYELDNERAFIARALGGKTGKPD